MPTTGASIIIGVMGVTGSGKSAFVQRVTQNQDVGVSGGIDSETHDVKPYYMTHKGCNYVLVDTPGFDDSMLSERQVYRQIAQWLESHYRAGQQFNGLIYLLPIHGTRQKGSEVRSHNLFKRLCGRQEPGSIVLGLTFCDVEVRENIDRRKDELINHWWADMITRDCVVEVPLDVPGCLKLIEHFAPELKMTLQVQSEVVDQGKAIEETKAASMLPFAAIEQEAAKRKSGLWASFRQRQSTKESQKREQRAHEERKAERARQEVAQAREQLELQGQRDRAEVEAQWSQLREKARKDQQQQSREMEKVMAQMLVEKQASARLNARLRRVADLERHTLDLRSFQREYNASVDACKSWAKRGTVRKQSVSSHAMFGYFCHVCLVPCYPKTGKVYGMRGSTLLLVNK